MNNIDILKYNTFEEFLNSNYRFEEIEDYKSIKKSLVKELEVSPYSRELFEDSEEFLSSIKSFIKRKCEIQNILRLTESQFIQLADRFCTEVLKWLHSITYQEDEKVISVSFMNKTVTDLLDYCSCDRARMYAFNKFALSFVIDKYCREIREICECKDE